MPVTIRCERCGKEFEVKPGATKGRRYCSQRCSSNARNDEGPERFWSKVDKTSSPNGCWLWMAARSAWGYGRSCIMGRERPAHRIAWELTNGPIPEGLRVCHSCDTPACCNVAHLWLGTSADNSRDASRKGRLSSGDSHHARAHPERLLRGEKHPRAVFTEVQVREIRLTYALGGITQLALAKRYAASKGAIKHILACRSWRHVK